MSVPIVHGRRPRFRLPLAVAVFSLLLLPLAILSSAGDTAEARVRGATECSGLAVSDPKVKPTSRTPAARTSYEVTFVTLCEIETSTGQIVMELHEDIRVPPGIAPNTVQIEYILKDADSPRASGIATDVTLTDQSDLRRPTKISVSHAVRPSKDSLIPVNIPISATVTVTFQDGAGISNPTEGGAFFWKVGVGKGTPAEAVHPDPDVLDAFVLVEDVALDTQGNPKGLLVDREVQLSQRLVHQGISVTAIGRGYKNGTSLTFWRDANFDGIRDFGEEQLCQTQVGGDDIGYCSFIVAKPPFEGLFGTCETKPFENGSDNTDNSAADRRKAASDRRKAAEGADCNFVNAVDGQNHSSIWTSERKGSSNTFFYSLNEVPQVLELVGFLVADVGADRRLHLQLRDFPEGTLTHLELGGIPMQVDLSRYKVPGTGYLDFLIDLPGEVRRGYQTLRVVVKPDRGEHGEHEVQLVIWVEPDAIVRAIPERALPNQRVYLDGQGFVVKDGTVDIASIKISGHSLDLSGVNGGEGPAPIDRQGNWRGFVDLPINAATTTPGIKELRITDSEGRGGSVEITIPPREVEVAPLWSRPGSLVTVTGKGFPASNRNRSSVNVRVLYDTENAAVIVAAEPDANGEFSVELRIPLRAAAPSSNTIRVEFDGDDGSTVVTTAPHEIAGAAIAVNPAAGPPGTRITLTGEGFRKFAKVNKALIGEVDVAGGGTVTTDANGDFSMTFLAPGVGTGRQTVRATVAGVTASATFDLKPSGMVPGNTIPVAEALEPLGDRLLRVFHFNNDAKVWAFYDPALAEDSNLDLMVAGETYLVMVSETAQAILNGKTRNLTCYQGNCWNQIIW